MLGRATQRHLHFLERLVDSGQADPVTALETISEAVTGLVMLFSQLVAANPSRFDALGEQIVQLHVQMLGLKLQKPCAGALSIV